MFLASRLIQGSAPQYQACEGQGAGTGLSRQVDISGSFARTTAHFVLLDKWCGSESVNSGRWAGVSANRTGPYRTAGLATVCQPVRRSASWHTVERQVSPSSSELWEHVFLQSVCEAVKKRIKPYNLLQHK